MGTDGRRLDHLGTSWIWPDEYVPNDEQLDEMDRRFHDAGALGTTRDTADLFSDARHLVRVVRQLRAEIADLERDNSDLDWMARGDSA